MSDPLKFEMLFKYKGDKTLFSPGSKVLKIINDGLMLGEVNHPIYSDRGDMIERYFSIDIINVCCKVNSAELIKEGELNEVLVVMECSGDRGKELEDYIKANASDLENKVLFGCRAITNVDLVKGVVCWDWLKDNEKTNVDLFKTIVKRII